MTAGPGRFGGKVVVVTGAGSGIGAAAADRFPAEAARAVYADRDAGSLSRTAASESALPVAVNVADPASVSGLVNATLDRLGVSTSWCRTQESGGAARSWKSPKRNGARSSPSISREIHFPPAVPRI